MTIIGTGIDATEIDRIREVLRRHGDRFLERVFTDGERAYCLRRRDAAPSLAARFAAKEAGMKALGTGQARGVRWRDLEVRRHAGSAPQLELHGAAADHLARLGGTRALLTLTHARDLAIAHVLIVRDAP